MIAGLSLSLSLFLFILIERLSNAISVLAISLSSSRSSKTGIDPLQEYASIQMLGSGLGFGTSIFGAAVDALMMVASGIASYAVTAGGAMLVFSLLYVAQEYYPSILLEFVEYWNSFLGPFVHVLLLAPMQVINTLFSSVVPPYNWMVWIWKQFIYNLLLSGASTDMNQIVVFGTSFGAAVNHTVISIADYIPTFAKGCDDPYSDTCYDPGLRTIDLITPMIDLRNMAAALTELVKGVCLGVNPSMEIIVYPLLDINTAKGVHNIVNSVLFSLLHVPSITVQRCKAYPNQLVMCLPDFEPPTNMMVSGLRSLGVMVDNWLDVSSIIIQESLGIDTGANVCDQIPLALTSANYSREVFGTARLVRVVGLTDGIYAVTDGVHIQYFSHYGATESAIITDAWPSAVDTSLGIAAITYYGNGQGERDHMGNPSTAMLGCACSDDNGSPPMSISCSIALYNTGSYGTQQSNVPTQLNVVFQTGTTAEYLSCRTAEISVQSVRWPVTRFTKSSTQDDSNSEKTCQSKGTCNMVDATIWVAPLCGSEVFSMACVSAFQSSACFPYCMAARIRGSGANGLVLYNAPDWKENVHLMERDCATKLQVDEGNVLDRIRSGVVTYMTSGDGSSAIKSAIKTTAQTILSNDAVGGTVYNTAWDPIAGCAQSSLARSVVSVDVLPGYTDRRFRSILMPGQPFAFAGDITLTSVRDSEGNYFVSVDRLYGNEVIYLLL